jgi:hypothetical protein
MRIHKKLVGLAAALLVSLSAATAHAGPIEGSFIFGGLFQPVIGSTQVSSWQNATGVNFLNLNGTSGAGTGQFEVIGGFGDFTSLTGTSGTIKDFTFTGPANPGYPTVPIVGFESLVAGNLRFDLLDISVRDQTADSIWLTGSGFFDWASAGFDRTYGTFELLGGSLGSRISFYGGLQGSDPGAPLPTPEPTSMMLFGSGIAAAAAAIRRRQRAATAA